VNLELLPIFWHTKYFKKQAGRAIISYRPGKLRTLKKQVNQTIKVMESSTINETKSEYLSERIEHEIPYISGPDEISNEDYHRGPMYRRFISSTGLKNYLISPKYAKWIQENPKPSTVAKDFGAMYHDLLAGIANTGSVDKTKESWHIFEPPINQKTMESYGKTSKVYQQALIDQQETAQGKLIDANDYKIALDMVNELLSGDDMISSEIRWLLEMGQAEQSHFIEYLGYGFKYRTDLKTKFKIIDWKTVASIEDPKPEHFSRTIEKYNYHISAAMYQFLEHELTGIWKPFFWVVQEKEPPYSFTILDSSEWSWEIKKDGDDILVLPKIGAILFLKLMDQYIWCNENKSWPGYSVFIRPDFKGHRIGIPEVPGWYKGQYGELNFYNRKP
jgi:hypothetical protein